MLPVAQMLLLSAVRVVTGYHPHSPELGHSSALPLWDYRLSEPTIHQERADSVEAQHPPPSLLRHHEDSALGCHCPMGAVKCMGRAGALCLRPSALLHQGHLRGQRKSCTTSKAMALEPQWP